MFTISEEAAAAVRAAYDREGELSTAIKLRRLFPGISDNAKARACVRTIAGMATGRQATAEAEKGTKRSCGLPQFTAATTQTK